MLYLALGAAALAFFVWASGGGRVFKRREWRFLSAAFALVAFTGGAYAAIRGAWEPAVVLIVVGLWLASSARQGSPQPAARPQARGMSLDEACSILGVEADATPAEVKAAYTRLMRLAHPDKGGTAGLASQLNAARDRLLKR